MPPFPKRDYRPEGLVEERRDSRMHTIIAILLRAEHRVKHSVHRFASRETEHFSFSDFRKHWPER
jgi:hypothetical protein